MSSPDLCDRLAEIIKTASRQYPYGSDIDEGCRGIADALLASEEWQAREAIIDEVANEHFSMNDLGRLAAAAMALRLAAVRGTT